MTTCFSFIWKTDDFSTVTPGGLNTVEFMLQIRNGLRENSVRKWKAFWKWRESALCHLPRNGLQWAEICPYVGWLTSLCSAYMQCNSLNQALHNTPPWPVIMSDRVPINTISSDCSIFYSKLNCMINTEHIIIKRRKWLDYKVVLECKQVIIWSTSKWVCQCPIIFLEIDHNWP